MTTQEVEKKSLELSVTPHVHSAHTTPKAMWYVSAALVPIVVASLIFFGIQQIFVILVSVAFAVGTEIVIKTARKKPLTWKDGSAALTGLLLALVLPPDFSLVNTALGSIFAIAVGKELFGGLGYNIFNPALVGRAFLQAAFPVPMTTWVKNNFNDTLTGATPLSDFKFAEAGHKPAHDFLSMFYGNTMGSLGETSALLILLAGIFLIIVGVVNWRIPLAMIIGVLVVGGLLYAMDMHKYPHPLFHLVGGGFMFAAVFMATDWVTSPLTAKGMYLYGFLISVIVVLIRVFGGLPEGVMYAILIMNGFVPLINRGFTPKIFGEVKK